jgi:hypothetical protein
VAELLFGCFERYRLFEDYLGLHLREPLATFD